MHPSFLEAPANKRAHVDVFPFDGVCFVSLLWPLSLFEVGYLSDDDDYDDDGGDDDDDDDEEEEEEEEDSNYSCTEVFVLQSHVLIELIWLFDQLMNAIESSTNFQVTPKTKLSDALEMMINRRVSSLPIVNNTNKLIGIFNKNLMMVRPIIIIVIDVDVITIITNIVIIAMTVIIIFHVASIHVSLSVSFDLNFCLRFYFTFLN